LALDAQALDRAFVDAIEPQGVPVARSHRQCEARIGAIRRSIET
jgi:hypothetical protein